MPDLRFGASGIFYICCFWHFQRGIQHKNCTAEEETNTNRNISLKDQEDPKSGEIKKKISGVMTHQKSIERRRDPVALG